MWLSATLHGIAVNKYRFIYTSALLTLAFYKTLPHQIHHKRSHPGDHTLSDHNTDSPFASQFPLNGCNCCHTWRIQQAEHQQGWLRETV